MLTAELVRYKINGECVEPRYILRKQSKKYLKDAEHLIRIFHDMIGTPQKKLIATLENYEGQRIDFKILRGLSKLLLENALFESGHAVDYAAFRHQVFSLAQDYYPLLSKKDLLHTSTRSDTLIKIADEMNISPGTIEETLYGDLPENQILTSFQSRYNPENLIRRYNMAQAQGLLYRSNQMTIWIQGDYRLIFQYLKLARLMHWIIPDGKGYRVVINGPASLLTLTQRYGIRMAMFLPGLILADHWRMTAQIKTPQGSKWFHLNDKCALTSHYKTLNPFDSALEKTFYEKWRRKKREWRIEREADIINLGDSIFIPDFTFIHGDGRIAHMEIVGYWTPEYLKKKLDKLNRIKNTSLFLAVNKMLNCDREDFNASVIPYRTGIRIKDVLDKLNGLEATLQVSFDQEPSQDFL